MDKISTRGQVVNAAIWKRMRSSSKSIGPSHIIDPMVTKQTYPAGELKTSPERAEARKLISSVKTEYPKEASVNPFMNKSAISGERIERAIQSRAQTLKGITPTLGVGPAARDRIDEMHHRIQDITIRRAAAKRQVVPHGEIPLASQLTAKERLKVLVSGKIPSSTEAAEKRHLARRTINLANDWLPKPGKNASMGSFMSGFNEEIGKFSASLPTPATVEEGIRKSVV